MVRITRSKVILVFVIEPKSPFQDSVVPAISFQMQERITYSPFIRNSFVIYCMKFWPGHRMKRARGEFPFLSPSLSLIKQTGRFQNLLWEGKECIYAAHFF